MKSISQFEPKSCRVNGGGSWFGALSNVGKAFYDLDSPRNLGNNLGFRVYGSGR